MSVAAFFGLTLGLGIYGVRRSRREEANQQAEAKITAEEVDTAVRQRQRARKGRLANAARLRAERAEAAELNEKLSRGDLSLRCKGCGGPAFRYLRTHKVFQCQRCGNMYREPPYLNPDAESI